MTESDCISIVIPVYNVEHYLCKCIDSVLCQTFKNLQIILVDDGSTDRCPSICDRYQKKDNRITVIHQKNQGLSQARNNGIDKAHGDYISFIDSDDYIAPDMYETLYSLMRHTDSDISMCNYQMVTESGKEIAPDYIYQEPAIATYTKEQAFTELLIDKKIQNYAWGKLYKAALFQGIRYPAGRKYEDIRTTYRLFEKSRRLVKCSAQKYFYVKRAGSIVNTLSSENTQEYISAKLDRFHYIADNYPALKLQNDYCFVNSVINAYDYIYSGGTLNLLATPFYHNLYQSFAKIMDQHLNAMKPFMNSTELIEAYVLRSDFPHFGDLIQSKNQYPDKFKKLVQNFLLPKNILYTSHIELEYK